MAGVVLGAIAGAFLAKWLGTLLTGGQTFNAKLASSRPGALLRAPITLGAHGAIAFWPIAAALTAGLLELFSVLRARRIAGGPARGEVAFGHAGPASSAEPWPGGHPGPPPAGRYGLPDADQPDRPFG